MNKKSAPRAAAVIEIGSNNVRMRVSQWAKGTVATLDRLEYPVSLGHDVFSSGDISFDSLRELSSVLSKFTAALRSYNIEKPKVISCTALREAKNRALVVDQLKVRNGLEVTVLEDSQEKAYIYKEVMERLDGAKLHPGNTMIAYVGSGSIGVAVYDGQKIIYTQNISMGALKLHDVLRHLHHQEADDFYYIIEEYLDTILNRIAISRFQVKNLVLTGSQLELVAQLCEAKKAGIPYQISVKNPSPSTTACCGSAPRRRTSSPRRWTSPRPCCGTSWCPRRTPPWAPTCGKAPWPAPRPRPKALAATWSTPPTPARSPARFSTS